MTLDVCPRCRAAKGPTEYPDQYGPCARCAVALRTAAVARYEDHKARHAAKAAESATRKCPKPVCGFVTIIDDDDPYAGRRCGKCGTDFEKAAA